MGALAIFFAEGLFVSTVHARTDRDLVALIAAGEVDAARALFGERARSKADWLFFEGRVAKSQGGFRTAIALFQQAIAREPNHLPAKRELAHTLMIAGDMNAAQSLFQTLLRDDPSPEQKGSYRAFLGQIKRHRNFSLSGSFSIISSSNANRGSSQTLFEPGVPGVPPLQVTSKAEPSTGLEIGVKGRHLWPLNTPYAWTLDWRFNHARFADEKHNKSSLSTKFHFGKYTDGTSWSLGPVFQRV